MSSNIILVSLVILVINCVKFGQGAENILLGKPSFANDYPQYRPSGNDGTIRYCMWLRPKPIVYIGYDLGAEYEIDKVVIKNKDYRGNTTFRVVVTGNIAKCQLLPYLAKQPSCSDTEIQKTEENVVPCNGKKGRYIVIYRGDFDNKVDVEKFYFCDIEAYGKKTGETGLLKRPKIQTRKVPKVTRSYFKHLSALRKNNRKAVVEGYSRGFVKLNKNCEPLVWDSKTGLTFGLACSSNNGKTRALMFAQRYYFYYATHGKLNKDLGDDFIKWLSPNVAKPTVHENSKMELDELKSKVKKGDIIDFDTMRSYSQEYIDQVFKWHEDGFVGLVIDHYRRTEEELNILANKLLAKYFNVVFDDAWFIFGGSKEYGCEDSDITEAVLDPEDIVEKMAIDHDYMLANYETFSETLDKLPPQLEIKARSFGNAVYKIVSKYDKLLKIICPCKTDPIGDPADKALLAIMSKLAIRSSIAGKDYKLPCIDLFPGDFKKAPKKISRTIEVFGEIKYTRNPTGLYIPPGETVQYRVLSVTGSWAFDIGCQTDSLVGKRPTFYRYPNVASRNVRIYGTGIIHSPFGGVLWIVNDISNTTLKIEIKNVVQAPFFNIQDGQKAVADWDRLMRHKAEGMWGQLAGQDFVICGASKEFSKLSGSDVKRIVEMWDKLVRSNYAIAGLNWREYRPEMVTTDIQTSAGYGHSGYPMVVWDDWYSVIINYTNIMDKGSWGMCHELGHNRQRWDWNFKAVGESTNNVFCLFQYENVWNQPYYGKTKESLNEKDKKEMLDYFNGGALYSVWEQSTKLTLFTYTQLMNQFGFGLWHDALKYYLDNPDEMKSLKNDNQERDMWARVTSKITKMNLGPLYAFWGWPISNAFYKELSEFGPCFLPHDFYFDISDSWKTKILKKYPNCSKKPAYYNKFNANSMIQGNRPNFMKIIK